MGRGRSNQTKLLWAATEYNTDWEDRNPQIMHYPNLTHRKLSKQLAASRWFKKHFVTPVGSMAFDAALKHLLLVKPNSQVLWWYKLAKIWPLAQIQSMPKNKVTSKFLHLALKQSEIGTEVEYRQQAQLFLILIQHFMGRAEAKELLKYYKQEGVKYRKIRADKGLILRGEELIEFRMRLGGHALLVPPLDSEQLEEDNLFGREESRAHGN